MAIMPRYIAIEQHDSIEVKNCAITIGTFPNHVTLGFLDPEAIRIFAENVYNQSRTAFEKTCEAVETNLTQ